MEPAPSFFKNPEKLISLQHDLAQNRSHRADNNSAPAITTLGRQPQFSTTSPFLWDSEPRPEFPDDGTTRPDFLDDCGSLKD